MAETQARSGLDLIQVAGSGKTGLCSSCDGCGCSPGSAKLARQVLFRDRPRASLVLEQEARLRAAGARQVQVDEKARLGAAPWSKVLDGPAGLEREPRELAELRGSADFGSAVGDGAAALSAEVA